MSKFISLSIIVLVLSSCSWGNKYINEPLDYENRQIEFQSVNCMPERDACLMVYLEYPEFTKGDSLVSYLANRIIRNSTLDFLGLGDVEAAVTPELTEAVKDLDLSFQRLKLDFPDTRAGWEAKVTYKELFRSDSILVLEITAMTYFGGAHPNRNLRYFNFNRQKGSLVPLSELTDDMKALTAKAESAFKSKYLDSTQSYQDAGFNFFGDKFILPANYALLGDSILLHYNHYEIAPYAAGDFDISVSIKN